MNVQVKTLEEIQSKLVNQDTRVVDIQKGFDNAVYLPYLEDTYIRITNRGTSNYLIELFIQTEEDENLFANHEPVTGVQLAYQTIFDTAVIQEVVSNPDLAIYYQETLNKFKGVSLFVGYQLLTVQDLINYTFEEAHIFTERDYLSKVTVKILNNESSYPKVIPVSEAMMALLF